MIVPLSGHLISQKWFSKSVGLFFWYHLCDIYDLQCIIFMFSWYSVCWGSQETNLKDIKNVKSRNELNGFVSIESKEQNHRLTCRRFVGAPQMYFKRLGMLLEILDFSYVKMFKQVLKIVPSRELTFPSRGNKNHLQKCLGRKYVFFLKSTLLVLQVFAAFLFTTLASEKRSRDSLFQTMHSKELGRGPYSAFLPNNHLEHEGAPSCPSASRRMFITPLKINILNLKMMDFQKGGPFSGSMLIFGVSLQEGVFLHLIPMNLLNAKASIRRRRYFRLQPKQAKGFNFRTNVNGNHVNTQHSGRWQV